jgi:hypothetical protein
MSATVTDTNDGKQNFQFFSKFNMDNSVKTPRTQTILELDLYIPMMYLHMQFEPYVQTSKRTSKQKLESGNWKFRQEG